MSWILRFVWVATLWFFSQAMNFLLPAVLRRSQYDPDKIADQLVGYVFDFAAPVTISDVQFVLFWAITIAMLFVLAWPHRYMEIRWPHRWWPSSRQQESVPILEAAQIAYQQTRGTAAAGWAIATEDRGGTSVSRTYVNYIGRYTSAKMFGVRRDMKHHEEIPKAVFKNDDVEVRDDSLIHLNKPSEPLFTKLIIRRRDLKKAIDEIKAI